MGVGGSVEVGASGDAVGGREVMVAGGRVGVGEAAVGVGEGSVVSATLQATRRKMSRSAETIIFWVDVIEITPVVPANSSTDQNPSPSPVR